MKKLLLTLLISLGLILTLTACSSSSSTDTSSNSSKSDEVEDTMEPPVSDVTDGTGVEGTWKVETTEDDTTELVQLALNSDKTFELYTSAQQGNNASTITSVDGTYTYDDKELVLTPKETEEGQDPGFFVTDDQGGVKLQYTVTQDSLNLTNSKNETETLTRVK